MMVNYSHSISIPLSSEAKKPTLTRLSKMIGQLRFIYSELGNSAHNLEALNQYSSVNAAVGSLMRFIARDAAKSRLNTETCAEEAEAYLRQLTEILTEDEAFD